MEKCQKKGQWKRMAWTAENRRTFGKERDTWKKIKNSMKGLQAEGTNVRNFQTNSFRQEKAVVLTNS